MSGPTLDRALPAAPNVARRRHGMAALGIALVLSAALAPIPAAAEKIIVDFAVGEADDDEDLVLQMYDTETGASWIEVYYKDGSADAWPLGNPNPDDPSSGGKGDLDMALQLLLQHGGNGLGEPALEDTPLGEHLTGSGKGLVPSHNPADEGGPHAQSTSSIKFENPADAYEEMMQGAGYPSAPGFDGNGGPMGGQIADAIRRGKKKGGGSDGSGENPNNYGFYDESMPGPPELVNPQWTEAEQQAYLQFLSWYDKTGKDQAAVSQRQ